LRSLLAAVGVLWRDGKVLLARRLQDPGAGLWALPGGKVEPGEQPEDALRRALAEGLDVSLARVEALPPVVIYFEENQVALLPLAGSCLGTPRVKAIDLVSEFDWFLPGALPPLLSSGDQLCIAAAVRAADVRTCLEELAEYARENSWHFEDNGHEENQCWTCGACCRVSQPPEHLDGCELVALLTRAEMFLER